MGTPTDLEREALSQSKILLRFVVDNKPITESVVKTIAESWEAAELGTWSPDAAARFWMAYNSLCTAIKPVTLDTILNNEPPSSGGGRSLSKRSARRYLTLLMTALFVTIVLQFVVVTGTTLLDESKKQRERINQDISVIVGKWNSVRSLKPFQDSNLSAEQKRTVSEVQNLLRELWFRSDALARKAELINYLTSLRPPGKWEKGNYAPPSSVETVDEAMRAADTYEEYFAGIEESARLRLSIISALLPLLLGLVGASAYVTRMVSEQIKDSTFSSTSPVRNWVRVGLGALVGAVIGFGWLGIGITSSTLALAFIGGYSIEPVFASIDSVAQKFR
jgi:hypothetical protein